MVRQQNTIDKKLLTAIIWSDVPESFLACYRYSPLEMSVFACLIAITMNLKTEAAVWMNLTTDLLDISDINLYSYSFCCYCYVREEKGFLGSLT